MITPIQLAKELADLRTIADTEEFHGTEDTLMLEILQAVADGLPEAQELARLFVEAYDPDKRRWYA